MESCIVSYRVVLHCIVLHLAWDWIGGLELLRNGLLMLWLYILFDFTVPKLKIWHFIAKIAPTYWTLKNRILTNLQNQSYRAILTIKLYSKKHVPFILRSLGAAANKPLHVRVSIVPVNACTAEFFRTVVTVSKQQHGKRTMARSVFVIVAAKF